MEKLFLSIKKGIVGTFKFSGRASRFEFTTYVIFLTIFFYGSIFLILFSELGSLILDSVLVIPLYFLTAITVVLSQFACGARRLEDMGKPKLLLILAFIPIVGLLFILYLMVTPSSDSNKK